MSLTPRVVIVYRRTELEQLLARHSTRQQAAFFLRSRRQGLEASEAQDAAQRAAVVAVTAAIPIDWRSGQVEREDLDRFLFEPEDVIIAVGQDGLVANVAKYLDGQPVIGVNPDPSRYPGVLVRHPAEAVAGVLSAAAAGRAPLQRRTMVEARLDDGQSLVALNEVYVGHPSHQSARYRVQPPASRAERQSSSGLLAGTGTGATGWLRSAWQQRGSRLRLPAPDEPAVCWFVREPWPSPTSGTSLTEGLLQVGAELSVTAEGDNLVAFGDGIEADSLHFSYGQQLTVRVAERTLNLVDRLAAPPGEQARPDRRRGSRRRPAPVTSAAPAMSGRRSRDAAR
jgi:NAD kinase